MRKESIREEDRWTYGDKQRQLLDSQITRKRDQDSQTGDVYRDAATYFLPTPDDLRGATAREDLRWQGSQGQGVFLAATAILAGEQVREELVSRIDERRTGHPHRVWVMMAQTNQASPDPCCPP